MRPSRSAQLSQPAADRWPATSRWAGQLRFALGWPHLGLSIGAGLLGWPGLAQSVGLSDRGLLIIGRACLPFLAILLAPGLVTREAASGTAELVATSARGLHRVWLSRLLLWLFWAWATALLFLVPVELRGSVRHGFAPEILSSLLDLAIYALFSTAIGYRLASETSGVLGGLFLWVGGVLVGLLPFGASWLTNATPLSVYLLGSVPALAANRLGWALASVGLAIWLWRSLAQPERLLEGRE